MRFLLMPDSFKGSVSSMEGIELLRRAALRVFPDAQIDGIPVADGGEGTVEALVTAMGGTFRDIRVGGPMGDAVLARYGLVEADQGAVIEMAASSGLPLVPPDRRDPLAATTFGFGELILDAIDRGARRLYLGLGGSATNDGGMGMLEALGVAFLDAQGRRLPSCGESLGRVHRIERAGLDPRLASLEIIALCDVTNPLLGPTGATAIYGPQKGAAGAVLDALERGMTAYAAAWAALGVDIASFPGAGAAGGLGGALCGVLGARLESGIQSVLRLTGFDQRARASDLVITGEGRLDGQSIRYGKGPVAIAKRCAELGKPVVILAGALADGAQEAAGEIEGACLMPILDGPMPLEAAMADAHAQYGAAAERLFRIIALGMRMGEGKQRAWAGG